MTGLYRVSSQLKARLFDGEAVPENFSEWRACPALYDADTLLPLLAEGLRQEDCAAAIEGGVAAMNCSVDWHDALEMDGLRSLALIVRQSRLPLIRLLLTASVDRDTAGFAAWFAAFSESAPDYGFLPVCKLYGREPHFKRNLEAVWRAGWRAMVFTQDRALMAEIAGGGGEALFRHANSPEDVTAMRAAPHRALVATSPQYLVPVGSTRRKLSVRPALPDDESRDRFVTTCLADIDVIATDHVAAGATKGPGLASQHHFLPALLHLAETSGVDVGALLIKATATPAKIFGLHPTSGSLAIVAPCPAGLSSQFTTDRDPFAGAPFAHVVVAVVTADTVARTSAFHTIINKE